MVANNWGSVRSKSIGEKKRLKNWDVKLLVILCIWLLLILRIIIGRLLKRMRVDLMLKYFIVIFICKGIK